MADESLQDLLRRLEDEREEADRLYGAALTALDRAIQRAPDLPAPPAPYDAAQIHPINLAWNILPDGPPRVDRSLKGRLRGFVWRLVGPAIEKQQALNAALVDHLNRNVAAHTEASSATAALIAVLREHIDGLLRLQHLLIAYLQTITLYVDTKDRAVAGQAQVLNAALGALSGDWLKRWETLNVREQRFNARVAATDDLRAAVALAQQTSLTLKREVERHLAGHDGHDRYRRARRPPEVHPILTPSSTSGSRTPFADRNPRSGHGSARTCPCSPRCPTCSTSAAAVASFSICCARGEFRRAVLI